MVHFLQLFLASNLQERLSPIFEPTFLIYASSLGWNCEKFATFSRQFKNLKHLQAVIPPFELARVKDLNIFNDKWLF